MMKGSKRRGRGVAATLWRSFLPIVFYSVLSFFMLYFGQNAITNSCVVQTTGTIAEVYAGLVSKKATIETLFSSYYQTTLKADSLRLILYTQEYQSSLEMAAVVNPDSSQKVGEQRFASVASDNDQRMLDQNQNRRCSAIEKEDSTLLACPVVDVKNFLIGFTLATYERPLTQAEIRDFLDKLKFEAQGLTELV